MKNKSGNRDGRDEWLETADEEFEQDFFEDEPSEEPTNEVKEQPARPEKAHGKEIKSKPHRSFETLFGGGDESMDEEETVDEGMDTEDDRELEETSGDKKKWILMGMAAICIIALAAFLFSDRFYNMIRGKSSYTLEKTNQQVSFAEGNNSVLLYGKNLLRCSQDGLQALNEAGQVVWDVPFTMSAPYMLKAGNYVSVADRLGTSVLLIQDGVVQTEITTEKKVLLQCVNEQGSSAVVLDGGDGHIVNLYSSTGEILMQRHTYSNSDGIPASVALNSDGSRMATAYVNYTGTQIQSIITIFDLTENGSSLVDRIVGSVSFEGSLISDVKFVGDQCFYAGSDRIGMLDASSSCQTLWEEALEYQIGSLAMEDSYFAVRYGEGLAGTVTAAEYNIVVYDYSGDILHEENLNGATYLGAWGDTVICGSGRSYYGMSAKGSPKWQIDMTEEYSQLIAFGSGDTVAALRNGELCYYRVTIKNAAEETMNE